MYDNWVRFKMYDTYINESIEQKIEDCDFQILPAFRGSPLNDYRLELMNEFNTEERDIELHRENPEILNDFRDYLRNVFDGKELNKTSHYWPPIVTIPKPETEVMIYWLIKFVHDCRQPHRVLHWLERNIYKVDLVSGSNSCLKAISLVQSRIRVTRKDLRYWAILKKEISFFFRMK